MTKPRPKTRLELARWLGHEVRTCPRCKSEEHTAAFQKVSKPMRGDDGTYCVCGQCEVYWLLTTSFLWGEKLVEDIDACISISDTITSHARLIRNEHIEQLREAMGDEG